MNADAPSSPAAAPFTRIKERLTTTLFLAALFHGIVILGVTFAVPAMKDRPAPTLEVLLVTGPDLDTPDNANAQYIAQRNQVGGGTTDERVRPANPASSPVAAEQDGTPEGNSANARAAVAGEKASEVLSARSIRSEVEQRSGDERPAQDAQSPLALSAAASRPIATNAVDTTLRLRGRRADGDYELVPNTRESELAPYLDAWRQKIELLGTLNFPHLAKGQATGNPVLEVALLADGRLGEVIVRRSSGRKDVDQAALTILRMASPFDPFPAPVRKKYQELRFAYEWQFLQGEPAKQP